MSNGNIHGNTLHPSDKSCLEGCLAIEERYNTVRDRFFRKWGVPLLIPSDLDSDFKRWRQLATRYREGDYRHTEAELKSMKAIAQWTIDVNCSVCGQPPVKVDL